jgi:hypothetical protein
MGVAAGVDAGEVVVERLGDGARRVLATDGGGWFGAVDLVPGVYGVRVGNLAGTAMVEAGRVAVVEWR